MKEKRKHPRFEMEVPVTLRADGRFIPASTINVSRGGICLLTDYSEAIKKGAAEVIIDLSSKERDVALRGRILRFEKGIGQKVAIQFTNLASKGRQSLEQFLHQYASK